MKSKAAGLASALLIAASSALTAQPAKAAVGRDAAPTRNEVKRVVIREARDLGVSPSLALAVAHVESAFDARAESHKGARGVMQIMPKTAVTEYGIEPRLLWNTRINVRLGLHFLKRLIAQYRGRVDLALSHYNGGSAVGRFPKARVIPATRKYVNKVLRLERKYGRNLWKESRERGYGNYGNGLAGGRQELGTLGRAEASRGGDGW